MRSAVDFAFIAFIASLVSEILVYIDNGFHWRALWALGFWAK